MAIELPDAPDWVIGVGYVGGVQMVTPSLNGIKGCEPFWKSGMNLKSQHLFYTDKCWLPILPPWEGGCITHGG